MPSRPGSLPSRFDRRRFMGLTAGGIAGMALAGCGASSGETSAAVAPAASPGATAPTGSPPAAFPRDVVRMSVYSKNHASSPLYWERFAPEGLGVEVQVFTNPSDMNRALEEDQLDFALMGVYNTLIEAQQGFTSKIIGMVSRQGIGLVARADGGMETIEDLAGKTIAVPPPGIQVLVLTALLGEAGLELDRDVMSVPLGYADHASALERGDVDAYMGTEPPVTSSIVSGAGTRLVDPYTTSLGDFNTALWASPHMLAEPDLCRAAFRMQREAAEYLTPRGENDPEVWRDLLVTQFEYEEAVYEEVLSNIGAVWEFDEERRSQLEASGAAMLEAGVLEGEPDYDSLLDLSFQEAAMAAATVPAPASA